MILSGFRRKNIQKQTNKALENLSAIVSSDKIDSILILSDKNIDTIIGSELGIESSKIETIIFKEKLNKDESSEGIITEDDFGLFGKIKNETIDKSVKNDFDLLINYSTDNLVLNYLVSISNAKFKVGFTNIEERLYDFMIAVKETEISTFNSELKKYLKILNKI